MTPISILIVDDHEVVRNGIRAYLETLPKFNVVGEAASGEEAIKMAGELIPDVVLMDLVMPGMDGIETTREVKKISPRTQIVVLTSYHEDEQIFPALKAGAISYVLKDMKMDKLAEAIQSAIHGEVTLHPLVATRVLRNLRGESQDESFYAELTDRELEVLKFIANGLSNSQIADQLVISTNTVKGHVSNILSKLHLADRTQVAVYAWQKGIVHRD
ncbi:MAG: response regulator transcription factor [Chloroflexi bacterium]|jgi:DNA-binding NarL/FixJ family response regulator|nr:response regulator transcription factor [Chloroflexota bacterium]